MNQMCQANTVRRAGCGCRGLEIIEIYHNIAFNCKNRCTVSEPATQSVLLD